MKWTPHNSRAFRWPSFLWALLAITANSLLSASNPAERLPRENLLLWRNSEGSIGPVQSPTDWAQRRNEIVRAFESIAGPSPNPAQRCALDVQIEEEVDCGSFVRRKLTYQSEPGSRVPAYLCIPKTALNSNTRLPGVLCLHPTDAQVGNGVVVGLGGKANRQYANELAELGFVTLSPSYPLLAHYQPDLDALGYASGTMKAIWDNRRGLDLLDSLPFVQPGRYATIGHSLGGHNSVFTAVFDPRLEVIVTSCGLDSFLDYYDGNPEVWKSERGWCQKRYMPKLSAFRGRLPEIPFDFHELIGALAPRAVFISAPLEDSNFRWKSVDRIGEAARPVFSLLGKPEALCVEHPQAPHDFPDPIRKAAYKFIQSHLGFRDTYTE